MRRTYSFRRSPPGAAGTHAFHQMPRAIRPSYGVEPATNNREAIVGVLDQGGLGSCALNAAAQVLRTEQVMELATALERATGCTRFEAIMQVRQSPPELASRLFWYLAAQACGGYIGQGDTGTCSYDVAMAAATVGIVREREYTYTDDESRIDPGTKLESLKRLAWDNRCSAVARVDADDMTTSETQNAFSRALHASYTILYATEVTELMENLMPGEIWQGPRDGSRIVGGHALVIVDEGPAYALSKYSASSELVYLVCNSWGRNWCDGGYFLMSQAALAQRWDGWIVSKAPEVL